MYDGIKMTSNFSHLQNACSPCYNRFGDNMRYQEVLADIKLGEDKIVRPKTIFYNQKSYRVKRVISVTKDVIYKYGIGYLFTVEIGSQVRKIFHSQRTGRWLVEKQGMTNASARQGGRHCCADILQLEKQ